ncbi:PLP-dependent transferase [Mytilinidion resinicola]|uniref:PLP-dependent transferase n=1 Tax=Mytilinidion resinicola TaxID=574789 RepID=A0A6A6Y922_9PEZI|nr:PLP-dependent transferase [Mytilinidion resinicola]KAF2805190.1 PLP-dependent transferase [Mytilinidion resinicola]
MSATSTLPVRESKKQDGAEASRLVKPAKELRKDFLFDQKYRNLNHGSFGTYPKPVRDTMRAMQDAAEARPDDFIRYIYPKLLDESRAAIAGVLNAPVDTLVYVPNATTGINTVLRNLTYEKGDKILHFSSIYGACGKTVTYITETTPAEAVQIEFTYPVEDDWLVEEMKRKVEEEKKQGNRVRIAIFDTVVSMPGVRMPFEKLAAACKEVSVLSFVDAAHAIGHVELDLQKLDPDFLVSNCHKWLYVPRGCAVFYVPVRNQHLLRSSLPTSHGFVPIPKPGVTYINPFAPSSYTPFIYNFSFVGTIDNSPYLCIPAALKYRESIGGEKAIMAYNSALANAAAKHVAKVLGTEILQNSTGTLTNCCLTNVRLPLEVDAIVKVMAAKGLMKTAAEVQSLVRDWMVERMVEEYDTFIAMVVYGGAWWVRFSGQVYLDMEDFEWAGTVLKELCGRVGKGEFVMEEKSRARL